MNRIDMQYVIHRMIKALWIAVLAGIIAAGGIWAKTKLDSGSNAGKTKSRIPESTAGFSDYLADQDSQRFIFLTFRLKENENNTQAIAVNSSSDSNKLADYGNTIIQRLLSNQSIYALCKTLGEELPDVNKIQGNNLSGMLRETILPSLDHQSAVQIIISLRDIKNTEMTEEALCQYRDKVYETVSAYVDSGELFDDLPVRVVRAEKEVEDNATMEDRKIYRLEDSTTTSGQVSLKKMLLFFGLGFLAAEGIVFLIAIFNNTVKSSRDLTENTDLDVLDYSTAGQEHDWTALTVKIRANITNENQLVVLRDAAVSRRDWIDKTKEMMAENGGREPLLEMTGLELTAEKLEALTNKKVLLAVKQEKTNYKTLRKLSDNLNQIHADVIGAIIEA